MMLTITYNNEVDSGDKWNVPIGLAVGKMLKIGKLPVKVMAGVDYSVALRKIIMGMNGNSSL